MCVDVLVCVCMHACACLCVYDVCLYVAVRMSANTYVCVSVCLFVCGRDGAACAAEATYPVAMGLDAKGQSPRP